MIFSCPSYHDTNCARAFIEESFVEWKLHMIGFISYLQCIYWRVCPPMLKYVIDIEIHKMSWQWTYLKYNQHNCLKYIFYSNNMCASNANRTHWRFSTQTCTPWFITRCVRRLSNNESTRWRHYTRLREKDKIQRKEIIASYDKNKPLFILFVIEIDINDIKWNRIIIDSSFIITQDWDD